MKVITFNVNGLRSILTKRKDGSKINKTESDPNIIESLLIEHKPDILCLQEVRCNEDIEFNIKHLGYDFVSLNCSKAKKGYSGTGVITKLKPIKIEHGINDLPLTHEINQEGRIITVEYEKFFVVNAYVPNSKPDLSRLDFRVNVWEKTIQKHINHLQNMGKMVIYCGDLNVAANDIDVHTPKTAKGHHGFTIEERNSFAQLLKECDLVDTFREKHPKLVEFSWFNPISRSREKGKGWRIDYILVSSFLKFQIQEASILSDYYGSDHIPCLLKITNI